LHSIATKSVGTASMLLGGGRQELSDKIDPKVGIKMQIGVGAKVDKGQPLCTISVADKDPAAAIMLLKKSFIVGDEAISKKPFFGPRITS